MNWLKSLIFDRIADPPEKKTYPYDCTVIYQDGSTDMSHFFATDASDALHLAQVWMPKRESIANEIIVSRRIQ